ncbi:MAG: hypothetical protein OXT09_22845 [Myxococcales bacterium]|nr:hypothetical protein [Myxococcales bacterium]
MPDDQQNPASDELGSAIEAVRGDPADSALWDRVEDLLDAAQRPTDVSELIHGVLADDVDTDLATEIGQRGVRFYETWYGDDSSELPKMLERVLQLDPGADWAFERLTVAYTVSERWGELLDAYDKAIESVDQTARRMQLLDEAAQAAKDFANEPDRAIGYLQQLSTLDSSNATLASSLERLLERQGRWDDLIGLWESRLDMQSSKQQRDTRIRMAKLFLDKAAQHDRALEQAMLVLEDAPEFKGAYDVLERVLEGEAAGAEARAKALETLKQHYLDKKKPKEVVRVLELGLPFAPAGEQRAALRELVERLVDLGDDDAAMKHQAALLVLEPMPKERDALRMLAERTREHGLFANILVQAADACEQPGTAIELRLEAARCFEEELSDEAQAIEIYQRVFAIEGADDAVVEAGRRVIPLLEKTDRERETLDVLARMSELEPEEAVRKSLLGKVARLAEKLGDAARAQQAWAARVGDDTDDVEALDALIRAASVDENWARLAELLEQRIKAPAAAERRREDLVRLAGIHSDHLDDVAASIEVWRRVQHAFGEDMESVSALTDLLARAERWEELADVLSQAAGHQIARFTELQTRLGDAYRERLDKPELAAERYRSALQVDPENASARQGQIALMDDERCRPIAIDALADAYGQTGEWQSTLGLLEARLSIEESGTGQAEILIEAAVLYEDRANDLQSALECLTRAFALIPDDRSTEKEIRRLAEKLDAWSAVVQAYRETIASFDQVTPRVAELRFDEGTTLEQRLQDQEGALAAYAAAASISRERVEFALAAGRVAAALGTWEDAVSHVLGCIIARGKADGALLSMLEEAAAEGEAWSQLCDAFTKGLGFEADAIDAALARTLHRRVADWHRHKRDDEDAAEDSLVRAAQTDAADAPTLRELADLQRRHPGEALVDTLLKLAEAEPESLDPLLEAGEVASEHVDESDKRVRILRLVFDTAAAMFRSETEASGDATPAHCCSWATDQLAATLLEADPAAALSVLLAASALPFEDEFRNDYLRRAAGIAKDPLKDELRAIGLYRDVLQAQPGDAAAVAALAELYEAGDRLPELLMLRRHELERERDPERLLDLRLEVARVLGEMESRGGRVETLRENLVARPGHMPSIEALGEILGRTGRNAELAELLVQQARALGKAEENAVAADLLRRGAALYEKELDDSDTAIATYQKLHDLEPEGDASAALARLHSVRGQHAMAARWLEVRLGTAPPDTRAVTAVELARAHIEANQADQARASLEQALLEDPGLAEARDLLARVYRDEESIAPLAQLLVDSAERAGDNARKLSLLEEAAGIYLDDLGTPERAVDPLRRAFELDPARKDLGGKLASAMLAAEQYDEARGVLEGLIEAYGRKRTPERAELHYQLARVAHGAGEVDTAFDQLEQATKMDLAHAPAMHMLAKVSQDQEQLDRAERAYRGLLMLVRRNPPQELSDVGPSEVFFELSAIATANGNADQADELIESAMEAATGSEAEARRFQRVLRERKELEQLMRLLDARLRFAQEPAAEAEILAVRAEVLVEQGDSEEALTALMKAIGLDPDADALHAQTRQLATTMGELERYISGVGKLAEESGRKRGKKPQRLAASLNLRLGDAIEHELRDYDRAAGLYAKVEASGERVIDAWMAMARVAGARGDQAEQRRVLAHITELEDDKVTADQRRDAHYALAELELADAGSRQDGVSSLEKAIDGATDVPRAKALLRSAVVQAPEDEALGALFERVARESGDELMLLEHFERRAKGDVGLDELRTAIDLALRIREHERAEAMLERAAVLARALEEDREQSTWVFSGLADCRSSADDSAGAIAYLREAVQMAGGGSEAETLGRELAELAAGKGGDLEVAAETYELLLERDRTDRTLWQPLLSVLAQIGDRARFDAFADRCIDDLLGPDERAIVHMARARFLIDVIQDERSAVEPLRALLDDEPGHIEATDLLTDIYQRNGMNSELADLLSVQFDRARDEENVRAIAELGLRIGNLYPDDRADDAIDAYRASLEWAPEHPGLLKALLDRLGDSVEPRDRAEIQHGLLKSASGDEAAELSLVVVDLWSDLAESELAQEALERGLEAAPGHEGLKQRLETWYVEREMWGELAQMLTTDAEHLGATPEAVGRLKNVAALYRDKLDDLAGAAGALRKALEIVPDDLSLLGELARNLASAGQHDAAIADVPHLLEGDAADGDTRVDLLKVRADLYLQTERVEEAVGDLEAAYAISDRPVAAALIDALERLKTTAFTTGDTETERRCVLRLVQLQDAAGAKDAARETLADWVEQDPKDLEALRALRARDEEAERWEDVITTCERLIEAEEGDSRIEAALGLADACDRAGKPEAARAGLERVHEENLSNALVRGRLRELYEAIEARAELAEILLADAYAIEDAAQQVALFQHAARLYIELGDPSSALPPLGEASKLQPDDHETKVLMIDIQIQQGELDAATQQLEEAIAGHKRRRSPELATLYQRMARLSAAHGDSDSQLKYLNQALETDRKSGPIAAELADTAIELANYDAAMKALRSITMMEDPQPITRALAFLKQAQIAHVRGDTRRAQHWARKAKSLDDNLTEVDTFLAEIEG